MSVVNFSVPPPLNEKIKKAIKEQGFASKAEFFRFAAIYLMQNLQQKSPSEEYNETMQGLSKMLEDKFHDKKMPSLEDQLEDL